MCLSDFKAFISYLYLLDKNVLEIMLKNIVECLKFYVLNISYRCSWVTLSSKIAVDI